MRFKKVLLILVSAAMLLSLCACSGGTSKTTASAVPSSVSTSKPTASMAPGSASTTKPAASAMPSSLSLVMATSADFPPYEYHDGGKIVGIDAEIAQAIADKLGMKLDIQDMVFDSVLSAVQTKKVDFGMSGITKTEDRDKNGDFSDSYATGVQVVIVKEGSKIKSVDDLTKGGITVGVQLNTTGDIYTTSDIEDKKLGKIERYNKGTDAVAALVAGKVDCVVIDNEPAKQYVKANKGLTILSTEYITEDYCIYFPEKSPIYTQVNDALKALIKDGTVKKIVDKYITAG